VGLLLPGPDVVIGSGLLAGRDGRGLAVDHKAALALIKGVVRSICCQTY
jgi:hypothetical protein